VTADYQKILQQIKTGKIAPVYLLDGVEPFYLDRLVEAFEGLLPPAERDFNLIQLYGAENDWTDVVTACRRFPMFAERQVVILKEAAQMRSLQELTGYVAKPAPTTVFVIEHRFKKVDGRGKLVKAVKDGGGVYFTSNEVKEDAVPDWIMDWGRTAGFEIGPSEAGVLATALGTDLQVIANELEKVRINAPDEPRLTMDLIRRFVAAGRDYNLFDFGDVLTDPRKADKRHRMVAWMMASPKSAPMPLLTASLYTHFSKLHRALFVSGMDQKEAAPAVGVPPFRLRDTVALAQRLGAQKVEDCLLTVAEYNARGVGVGTAAPDRALIAELAAKLQNILEPADATAASERW